MGIMEDKLKNYIHEIFKKYIEFEYNKKINNIQFENLKNFYNKLYQGKDDIEDPIYELDVVPVVKDGKNFRITIKDKQNIVEFCKKNADDNCKKKFYDLKKAKIFEIIRYPNDIEEIDNLKLKSKSENKKNLDD